MIKTYRGYITSLKNDEVFVFGANESGFHGAGSAGYASFGVSGNRWREFKYDEKPIGWKGIWNQKGYIEAQIGEKGKSYGIVTIAKPGNKKSISKEELKSNINKFYLFAKKRPHLKFYVAQECKDGLNGYSYLEMAELYSGNIPDNVYFEENFAKLLKK